ncbi:MAG: ribonuclease HIII [Ignavibacteriae bacterium]|nr:ribonuclease HIII [Ignavibacteriota bacterium]
MIENKIQTSAYNKISELSDLAKNENYQSSKIELKQYNYEVEVAKNKQKIKIQVYFGKKGLKTILQGNNTSKEFAELNNLINGNFSLDFQDNSEENFDKYIGTDETGKGDFFGPLIIAGFYVNEEIQNFLINLGVKDSKELADTKIDEIAKIIKSKFPKNYSIVIINPEKYNQLYDEFKNLNKILNWAHSKVIENLYETFQPETVIIDQFSKTPINISLKNNFAKVNFVQIPKAEKYVGVAAASILARNELNKWFNKKNHEGIPVLKGASTEVENSAKIITVKFGIQILNKISKVHFKTTKKIFEN